jgi:hypothetical protein
MDWFDPSEDVVIDPARDRVRWWQNAYATNRHGRFFDAACDVLDRLAAPIHDHRAEGYVYYEAPDSRPLTVYQAFIPAPWAAQTLELAVSAGAQEILFLKDPP